MEELDKDKLGKIVELAKNGVGGEKENAIRIVKNLCEKHHLVFEDVMNSNRVREYTLKFKSELELELLIVIYYRYGMVDMDTKDIQYSHYRKMAMFTTTPEKYIEVLNAFSVLKELYKNEKKIAEKAIFIAFRKKHELYYQPTQEEWKKINRKRNIDEKKKTEKEKEEEQKLEDMANGMSRAMDEAIIHKQLK